MADLKQIVGQFVQGLVEAVGAATVKPEMVDHPNGTDQAAVVREGYRLVKLEGGTRGRRAHVFRAVRAFGQWLRRHADPAKVEILGNGDSIAAALDPADPNGDLVQCLLEAHPRAKPWLEVLAKGVQLTQRQLWLFVRARPQDFGKAVGRNGADLGSYGPILAAELQKLEVSKGGKVRVDLDGMGNVIFAAGEEKTEVSGKLPSSFEIRIPLLRDVTLGVDADGSPLPVEQEPLYALEVFLTLETKDGGAPTFRLECPGLELAQIAAREDAFRCLRSVLESPAPEGYLVGAGSVNLNVVPKPLA